MILGRFFLNFWKQLAVLSVEMNDKPTQPAPAETLPPRSESARVAARFGTIGFDLYAAAVKAESERLFRAQAGL